MSTREETKQKIIGKGMELLTELYYNPKKEHVDTIVTESMNNKSWIWDMFEKHPFYNGNGQIVFKKDMCREFDTATMLNFKKWVKNKSLEYYSGDENTPKRCEIRRLIVKLCNYIQKNIDEELAEYVNKEIPDARLKCGQKLSRATRKVLSFYPEIYNDKDFAREFAKFADATNPLNIVRYTVLSINPIDFWTMSFGNSWTSCHSIDVHRVLNISEEEGESYSCCYSYGTESYMMDQSSMVFYTVSSDYKGNDFELQRKINRCMIHLSEDGNFIQSRVYPGTNDYTKEQYTWIREIVQKVVSEMFGFNNRWKLVTGNAECKRALDQENHHVYHYKDYEYFENCNVSYPFDDNKPFDKDTFKKIQIGHKIICPECGTQHTGGYSEQIACKYCYTQDVMCHECGTLTGSPIYVGEHIYCPNCTYYCDYHNKYEVFDENTIKIENGKYVCKSGYENGNYVTCKKCGRIISKYYATSHNGKYYCSVKCTEE